MFWIIDFGTGKIRKNYSYVKLLKLYFLPFTVSGYIVTSLVLFIKQHLSWTRISFCLEKFNFHKQLM